MVLEKKQKKLNNQVLKNNFTLECLGVKICFSSNNKVFINQLKKRMPEIVPIPWLEMPGSKFAHDFSVIKDSKSEKNFELYREAEFVLKKTSAKELLEYLESQIRSVIAEYAQDFIFLHAGVVSWKGKGIIIPGKTLSGKTTLVSELIKRDCEYLSDEFAVIDKNGYVHPFPKKLSVRGIIGEYKQVDLPVSKFGGKTSQAPVPIGFMLLTEYKKEKRKPRIRIESAGEGVMAGVANSISVRQNPKFVLEVLSVVANRAVILKGKRGDAGDFAEFLLNYLEKLENSKASSQSSQQLGKNFVVKV